MITERRAEVHDRSVPGHWEGDLIVGAFNRSAIGTLVERTSRFTLLVHLPGASHADSLKDGLLTRFDALPAELRRSLAWDQGGEMCQHHTITELTGTPVFFCHAGRPWERPSNENTNRLLRDYFPKSTDLRVHSADDLQRVSDELNRRPAGPLDGRPRKLYSLACSHGACSDDPWNLPSTPGELQRAPSARERQHSPGLDCVAPPPEHRLTNASAGGQVRRAVCDTTSRSAKIPG